MPSGRDEFAARSRWAELPLLALLLAAVGATLVTFFDRGWWPPDDGAYAYVADRILKGDRLNGEVQDVHLGYVNYLHALFLYCFGADIRALRYGLLAITLAQSMLVYALLRQQGRALALACGFAAGALTFVQFTNPSANWYALALAILTVAALRMIPADAARREIIVGFLVGLTFGMRQLSGVFLALGVLVWLLVESRPEQRRRGPPLLARALLLICGLMIAFYTWRRDSIAGWVMFGLWPPLLALLLCFRVTRSNAATLATLRGLAIGAGLALLPLPLLHLWQGTLASWLQDTVLSALHLSELPFIGLASYGYFPAHVVHSLYQGASWTKAINGVYWMFLIALPALVGASVLCDVALGQRRSLGHPLPIVALFFALVSLHFQIPLYLTYSSAFSLAALMLLWGRRLRAVATAGVLALSGVGIAFHAGEPPTRTPLGMVAGERTLLSVRDGLPKARVAMTQQDYDTYSRILALIAEQTGSGESILALPMNAEFYFLADRPAAVRFFNSAFGMRDMAAVQETAAILLTNPPRLIVHRREDKYNSDTTWALLDRIAPRYELLDEIGEFDIYRLNPP